MNQDRQFLLWALMLCGSVKLNGKGYPEVTIYCRDVELLGWFRQLWGGSVTQGLRTARWSVQCQKARELLLGLPVEQMGERLRKQVERVLQHQGVRRGRPKRSM